MSIERKKEVLIAIFVTLYTLLFFLGTILYAAPTDSPRLIMTHIVMVFGALIWAALMVCATAFVTHRSGSNLIIALLPPIILIALSRLSLDSIIGALILFGILLILQRRLNWELTTRVKLQIVPIFYNSTRLALYALLVVLIALSIPIIIRQVETVQAIIPASYVSTTLRPLESIIAGMLPGYATNQTVDELIEASFKKQTSNLPFDDIGISQSQKVTARNELSQQYGMTLTGQETLADIIANVLNTNIQRLAQENRLFTVGLFILLAFLTTKTVIPLLIWPTLGFVRMFLYIAIRIGLISTIKTQVEVDRFTL